MTGPVVVSDEVYALMNEMIEEAQTAANRAASENWRSWCLAKRDALTELKLRLRDGRAEPRWIHQTMRTYAASRAS